MVLLSHLCSCRGVGGSEIVFGAILPDSVAGKTKQTSSTLGWSRHGLVSASVRPKIGHPFWLVCWHTPHPAKGSNEGYVRWPVIEQSSAGFQVLPKRGRSVLDQ